MRLVNDFARKLNEMAEQRRLDNERYLQSESTWEQRFQSESARKEMDLAAIRLQHQNEAADIRRQYELRLQAVEADSCRVSDSLRAENRHMERLLEQEKQDHHSNLERVRAEVEERLSRTTTPTRQVGLPSPTSSGSFLPSFTSLGRSVQPAIRPNKSIFGQALRDIQEQSEEAQREKVGSKHKPTSLPVTKPRAGELSDQEFFDHRVIDSSHLFC